MVQKDTGWTDDYLLWGLSWTSVQMKLADAPRYVYRGKERAKLITDEKELIRLLERNA